MHCASFPVLLIILLLRSYSGSEVIIHEPSLLKCMVPTFLYLIVETLKDKLKPDSTILSCPRDIVVRCVMSVFKDTWMAQMWRRGQAELVIILECGLFRDP